MFLILGLRWWYIAGWQWAFKRAVLQRLAWCNETFSVLDLIKTLFAPFKQTYNRGVKGPLDLKMRAFLDNIVSRVIGFLVRSFIILAGLVAALFVLISGLLFMLIWPFIPLSLALSIVLMIGGAGL